MPKKSKPRSRKKRRATRPPWLLILWVLAIANVAAGLLLSPEAALRRVRVVGAELADQARIEAELRELTGRPVARIDRLGLQDRLASPGWVQSASVRANVFGRSIVEMRSRTPLAQLVGVERVAVDAEGVVFATPTEWNAPCAIDVPRSAAAVRLGLAATVRIEGPVAICRKLAEGVLDGVWTVGLNDSAIMTLTRADGLEVILGTDDRIEDKLAALETALGSPRMDDVATLNLTAPDRPSFVPKSGGAP